MLTIKEPIALKTVRPLQAIRQDMTERIQANYSLMKLSIRKEELLHITSQPAEIYFANSENVQILTNINNQNQQEIRLEVINNLMNRILVAQTENFTYQDIVYISSVLRKLGIRDEKNFMKQIVSLQNEHKETKQLLHSYEKNQQILQQMFKPDEKQEVSVEKENEILNEKERRYYVHDAIFNRLNTGKIYQKMRQFSKTYLHESSQIHPVEMQIAEQTKAAENFLLQNIKNEITGKMIPLYYLHQNRYEYLQEVTDEITMELEEQISAAILINLAQQSYVLRQKQIEENSHYWYSMAKSFFQTSENTWKRYESNLIDRKIFSSNMLQVIEEMSQSKHLEGNILSTIVEEYYKNVQQWKEQKQITEMFQTSQMVQEHKYQQTNLYGGSYHLTQEEFALNYLAKEDNVDEEETQITVEQLQKQLEIFNQRNYENYKKISEIEKQQRNVKDRKVNRQKAQLDVLRALEEPQEVLKEYLLDDKKDPVVKMREKTGEQIYELFSEETKEIYRQYLKQNVSKQDTVLEYIMAGSDEREETERINLGRNNQDLPVQVPDKTKEQIYELFSEETKASYREFLTQSSLQQKAVLENIMVQPKEHEVLESERIAQEIKRYQEDLTVVNTVVKNEVRKQQIEFIHKTEEKLMNEELLEEIRNQNHQIVKTEVTEENSTQNRKEIHQVVQESINRIETNRIEDIEEIVQQSIKRQLNNLSEQVYGKLEKKLQTERKRRGYF